MISKQLTKQNFISQLKNNYYKKIVFLTGAGISVSAGIPDFRTPVTGLYSIFNKYQLPKPQALFSIGFAKNNPQTLYQVVAQMNFTTAIPAISHKFIKKFYDNKILHHVITQNVDGLELIAGLPKQYLKMAHGHNNGAHCMDCNKSYPIQVWNKAIETQQIARCDDCNGFIKICNVLWDETLGKQYEDFAQYIQEADLVIIMGTSLKVYPFAFFAELIHQTTPIVLFNNQLTYTHRSNNFLWIQGDIDKNVTELVSQLGWQL